jgi:hypothetical protein
LKFYTEFRCLRARFDGGISEHDNELSSSLKDGKVIGKPRDIIFSRLCSTAELFATTMAVIMIESGVNE